MIKESVISPAIFKKVKVRKKDARGDFVESLNEALSDTYQNLYGRSVRCNGNNVSNNPENDVYVFPLNGFKFLFNPNVDDIHENRKTLDTLQNVMDNNAAKKIFIDMVDYSYCDDGVNFVSALESGKEIVIYNIPYFYAVQKKDFPIYSELFSLLKKT